MHPNPAFRVDDREALLAAAERIGFAHIMVPTPEMPMVIHAPVTRAGGDRLRFHVARANRARPFMEGATVLASVAGAHGYVSPNWYAVPGDQVPTWNYEAIEIEGVTQEIGRDALIEQLDALAAAHEPRVNPARPWTREKMAAEPFEKMLRAIVGFEIAVTAARGTTKLSQNKSTADRAGVIAGLAASGNDQLAEAMRG